MTEILGHDIDGNRLVLALAIGTGAWIGCFAGMALDELIGG